MGPAIAGYTRHSCNKFLLLGYRLMDPDESVNAFGNVPSARRIHRESTMPSFVKTAARLIDDTYPTHKLRLERLMSKRLHSPLC